MVLNIHVHEHVAFYMVKKIKNHLLPAGGQTHLVGSEPFLGRGLGQE